MRLLVFVISSRPWSIACTEMPGTGRKASNGGGVKKSRQIRGELPGVSEGTADARTDVETVPNVAIGACAVLGTSVGGGKAVVHASAIRARAKAVTRRMVDVSLRPVDH